MTVTQDAIFRDPLFEPIRKIQTVFDAMQVMRKTSNLFRFSLFSVLFLPNVKAGSEQLLSRMSIISSWPPELIGDYDRLGLARNSPVLEYLRTHIAPLVFQVKYVNNQRPDDEPKDAHELFGRFGLTTGVYFPVYYNRGQRFAVSFMGDREPLTCEDIRTLALFSTLLVEQLAKVTSAEVATRMVVNAREIEVLQWIAEGKTSSEIARITGLSEHTVNHYATIATQKLGCSNRTQAVVHAIRLGIFD